MTTLLPTAPGSASLTSGPGADPATGGASVWLWHLPSASFALLCAAVVALTRESAPQVAEALVGIAVIVVASLVAVRAAPRAGGAVERAVPLVLLVAAALVHVAAGGATASTILVGGLPVAWLAFTFGISGTLLGCLGIVLVAAAPYLSGAPWPDATGTRIDVWVITYALVSMAWVTYGASRVLTVARAELVARADALALEASTTRTVLDAVDAAVCVLIDGNRPVSNDQAVRAFRRGGVCLDGEPARALTAGDRVLGTDRATPVPAQDQALVRAARGETFHGVLQWMGEPGDQVAMVCSAHDVGDGHGQRRGSLLVAWDATELLESLRVREEFLATVSHELRTPLTSVIGYLEMHDDASAIGRAEMAEHCVAVAHRNAESLRDRIEQLLSVARDEEPPAVAVVDVASLVVDRLAEHRHGAAAAGLSLGLVAPPRLCSRVNPTAIEQVVDNLVSNAVKYTETGGVTLWLEPGPASVHDLEEDGVSGFTLSVSDTGVGMDDREQRHAFDRFYRAERAVRSATPGLGIGLSITKKLVESHRGSIEVRSRPGSGTRFDVHVPALAATTRDESAA